MSDLSPVPDAPSVEQLLVLLAERDAMIVTLGARVAELEARLGKNSQNSSKPPSSDGFVKPPPRSLRRRSGRKPGKQAGEQGMRLEPVADPDRVITHVPDACGRCGRDLAGAPVVADRVRQVFDLPPIRLQVSEHRVQERQCSCGSLTVAPFPAVATASTCYGPVLQAVGLYLMGRHHVPVARTAELMDDILGAPVSTGWLAGLAPRAAVGLEGFDDLICARLRAEPVAHFDETGMRVAGRMWWAHVASTSQLTHLHLASGRGGDSIGAGRVLGSGFDGVAVHDCLSSYNSYQVAHALCCAHLLRELVGVNETTGQDWARQLAELLIKANRAVVRAKHKGVTKLNPATLRRYHKTYRKLVTQGQALHPDPAPTGKQGRPRRGYIGSLLRRFDIYENDILRFMADFQVPFDNNQAERDIRMVRLQAKISGGWRSTAGANAFLKNRTYISTAIKNNKNVIDALTELFTGNAWIPQPTASSP